MDRAVKAPVMIGAIDAGTNAIRMVVAEAKSPAQIDILERERVAVRLGHQVFIRRNLEPRSIAEAGDAFRHFRAIFDRYGVTHYRAVATSAARNARNRNALVDAARNAGNIHLEVISGTEEARLVRIGVLAKLPDEVSPRLIVDLGGGSLEFNLLRERNLDYAATIPIGVVRLLETFDADGALTIRQEHALRGYVEEKLQTHLPTKPRIDGPTFACGGNAEALALLTGTDSEAPVRSMRVAALRRLLRPLLRMSVEERMEAYGLRRDRADVIDLAALIFVTLGQWLGLDEYKVTGAGVRDGILDDLAREHFHARRKISPRGRAKLLVSSCRDFGLKHGYDDKHAEHVRKLAKRLFDRLAPHHGLGQDSRLVLEMGALLHDVGQRVNYKDHAIHGDYLLQNGHVPGLTPLQTELVACLVRFHSRVDPSEEDARFSALSEKHRDEVRTLTSILRLADGLDCEHRQAVSAVDVKSEDERLALSVKYNAPSQLAIWGARRKDKLLRRTLGVKIAYKSA